MTKSLVEKFNLAERSRYCNISGDVDTIRSRASFPLKAFPDRGKIVIYSDAKTPSSEIYVKKTKTGYDIKLNKFRTFGKKGDVVSSLDIILEDGEIFVRRDNKSESCRSIEYGDEYLRKFEYKFINVKLGRDTYPNNDSDHNLKLEFYLMDNNDKATVHYGDERLPFSMVFMRIKVGYQLSIFGLNKKLLLGVVLEHKGDGKPYGGSPFRDILIRRSNFGIIKIPR